MFLVLQSPYDRIPKASRFLSNLVGRPEEFAFVFRYEETMLDWVKTRKVFPLLPSLAAGVISTEAFERMIREENVGNTIYYVGQRPGECNAIVFPFGPTYYYPTAPQNIHHVRYLRIEMKFHLTGEIKSTDYWLSALNISPGEEPERHWIHIIGVGEYYIMRVLHEGVAAVVTSGCEALDEEFKEFSRQAQNVLHSSPISTMQVITYAGQDLLSICSLPRQMNEAKVSIFMRVGDILGTSSKNLEDAE